MKRMRGFETIRNRVITMTCVYFTHFLRQRDYDGKLRFDHKGEKLEIKVGQPAMCLCCTLSIYRLLSELSILLSTVIRKSSNVSQIIADC